MQDVQSLERALRVIGFVPSCVLTGGSVSTWRGLCWTLTVEADASCPEGLATSCMSRGTTQLPAWSRATQSLDAVGDPHPNPPAPSLPSPQSPGATDVPRTSDHSSDSVEPVGDPQGLSGVQGGGTGSNPSARRTTSSREASPVPSPLSARFVLGLADCAG